MFSSVPKATKSVALKDSQALGVTGYLLFFFFFNLTIPGFSEFHTLPWGLTSKPALFPKGGLNACFGSGRLNGATSPQG